MRPDPLDRLEELFRLARLVPADERPALLEAACGDDDALRGELAELLAAADAADAGAFLDAPPTLTGLPPSAEDLSGRSIGPYRLQRRLGGGGMGDVYLALRTDPFKRYVALKVVRAGMASPEAVERFQMERQILASLDHPAIARLLDGGYADDRRPYFVMEYVDGRPITTYCDDARMDVRGRLRLFAEVCRAVHHAHQNLVLHRDLKPSNILVTPQEAVKLLDFGIAKLLNPHLSHVPVPVTRADARVMTPEYASPEQVRGEPLTTASDVYSLGVVLYELLTGRRPYELRGRTTHEVMQVVCGQEPERPSTRVVRTAGPDAGDAPEAVSRARASTPERLRRTLRGDLDVIVLRALRKEPGRRYASAEQLAADVERHLAGLPVQAHRGTRRYRLGKFVRRHRTETAAAALVVVLLTAFGLYSARQARVLAQERDRAHLEARKSEQVTAFLLSLFERADPTAAPGDTVTVREVLERGTDRIDAALAGQPAVQADLLATVARAYDNLGRSDRAADLLARALDLRTHAAGSDDPEALALLYDLAELRARLAQYDEAEALFRRYVAAARVRDGVDGPDVLRGTYRLWGVLHQQGAASAADSLFDALLAMERALPPADDTTRAYVLAELGYALAAMKRYPESEDHFRRALAMEQRLHGGVHPRVAYGENRLAAVLTLQGRAAEAEPHAREAVRLNELLHPEGHDESAGSLRRLGAALQALGRLEEAEAHFRAALAMMERLHGTGLPVASYARTLADFYAEQGAYAEAEPHVRAVAAVYAARYGADAPITQAARADVGDNLRRQGRLDEAEALLRPAYDALRAAHGDDHPRTRRAAAQLADLYDARGRAADAVALRAR